MHSLFSHCAIGIVNLHFGALQLSTKKNTRFDRIYFYPQQKSTQIFSQMTGTTGQCQKWIHLLARSRWGNWICLAMCLYKLNAQYICMSASSCHVSSLTLLCFPTHLPTYQTPRSMRTGFLAFGLKAKLCMHTVSLFLFSWRHKHAFWCLFKWMPTV